MNRKITVMLVSDHPVTRAGYRLLLSQKEGIEVVFEAGHHEEACQYYQDHRPMVTVVDLNLPGAGGLEALRRILARAPSDKRGCLTDRPPEAQVQVLLDATDPFDPAAVETVLMAEAKRLPRYGRLDLYILDDAAPMYSKLAASICHPGNREQADEWRENAAKLDRQFKQLVADRINAIAAEHRERSQERSPIMEALSELPTFESGGGRLVLMSDGLENSTVANFYKGAHHLARLKFDPAQRLAHFHGAEAVLYLQRQPLGKADRIQQQNWFKQIWADFFQAADIRFELKPIGRLVEATVAK